MGGEITCNQDGSRKTLMEQGLLEKDDKFNDFVLMRVSL